jgi:hypothetical protein
MVDPVFKRKTQLDLMFNRFDFQFLSVGGQMGPHWR